MRNRVARACALVVTAAAGVGLVPGAAAAAAPPSVSITTPSGGAVLRGSVTIEAAAAADEPGGRTVAVVDFFVDGVLVGTDTEAPYEHPWNTAVARGGEHTLVARVTDAPAGEQTSSEPVTVTVAAPSVALTSPAPGAAVHGGVPLAADALAYDDATPIVEVRFLAGTGLIAVDDSAPYTAVWPTDGLPEGPVALRAVAVDNTGQTATATSDVEVTRPAPTATLTAPAGGDHLVGTVTLTADASAYAPAGYTVDRVEFLLDGAVIASDATAPYGVAWDTSAVPPGAHELRAVAVDAPAGRQGASPPVTVDVVGAPVIAGVSPDVAPPGAQVTVTGTWFTGTTSVGIGGIDAPFAVTSDGELTATVPAGAVEGPVVVTNPRGSDSAPFGVDVPPGAVTALTARAGDKRVVLGWTKPADGDLAAIVVRRASGTTAPATPTAGTPVYQGLGSSYTDLNLVNHTTYSYSVWARDLAGSYGQIRSVSAKPVPPVATVLRVAVSRTSVTYGGALSVSGTLTRSDGRTAVGGEYVDVYVRRQGSSSWTKLTRLVTSSTGAVRYAHAPAWNAEYTLRHPATAFFGYAASSNVKVGVRPALAAKINVTAALVGTTATISGTVKPAHYRQPVYLQQYSSTGWRTIATRYLSSAGGYSFAVKPAATGSYAYRVHKPADWDHLAVTSATLRLVLYRAVIARINWDAAGNDLHNPNGEWVVVRNTGTVAVNLRGWRLDAGDPGQSYLLPSYPLAAGASVNVHTGSGTTGSGRIYLGSGKPIWNNDGDTGSLYDPRNVLASRLAY